MNDIDDSIQFKKMLEIYQTPQVQELLSTVGNIAEYRLPKEIQDSISAFRKYTTDPEPPYITKLRQDTKSEYWWKKHIDGIAWHTPVP